jgi:hypothetical protein
MGLTTDRMERGRKNWSNHGNVKPYDHGIDEHEREKTTSRRQHTNN